MYLRKSNCSKKMKVQMSSMNSPNFMKPRSFVPMKSVMGSVKAAGSLFSITCNRSPCDTISLPSELTVLNLFHIMISSSSVSTNFFIMRSTR